MFDLLKNSCMFVESNLILKFYEKSKQIYDVSNISRFVG